ncbi:multidrug efflux SMR transporter [Sinobaca sp. H24]|uniref:DMT family transporter n=1 Tax=Sinobaca sp. H24 TaxID=2923376 RepID=UPI00209836BD|nr:multidrug efflux SMR transporter [Sinobaca sp. H24]
MAWVSLIFAGLFEMVGVTMINKLHHDRSMLAFLGIIGGFGISFVLLSFSMQSLPMGTAYAVWTGIGAAGGALMGMLFYRESADWKRIACIGLIIASAVGLKLVQG